MLGLDFCEPLGKSSVKYQGVRDAPFVGYWELDV
jgi:hypothetical protein